VKAPKFGSGSCEKGFRQYGDGWELAIRRKLQGKRQVAGLRLEEKVSTRGLPRKKNGDCQKKTERLPIEEKKSFGGLQGGKQHGVNRPAITNLWKKRNNEIQEETPGTKKDEACPPPPKQGAKQQRGKGERQGEHQRSTTTNKP